ncbi:hypothetical protein WJR50_16250 [Catalinimonas sp. 4WD22]|uniref:hypothetical protein n=1 Tax=Catalinimonas locisalis TaxID=3133978 RepID=UPI0031016FA6
MEHNSLESLLKANLSVLIQLENMLMQMNEDDYIRPLDILNQSTVAQHTRHSIEFYQCLLKGLHEGQICYSRRKRNKTLEQSPTYTLNTIRKIKEDLFGIKSIAVKLVDDEVCIDSNTNRELLYCMEHAVHHMAIIKIALRSFSSSINLPDNFGVAASTIRFHNSCVH